MGSFIWDFVPLTSKRSLLTQGVTTLAPSSSIAMPIIVKPLAAYFCWISISSGISPRHDAHHVAHKLSRTTLPLYWDRERSLPSRSLRVISGTGLPAALGLPAELPAATLTTPLRGRRVARSAR